MMVMIASVWPPSMSKATRLPSGSQHRTWPVSPPTTYLERHGQHHQDYSQD
jgi:hypothetical protein